MPAVLLDSYTDWFCPACGASERTRPVPNRYHTCPALHYLSAPMLRAGADAELVAHLREDYLAGEIQAEGDDGRPYMSIETRYADGRNDIVVNAPLARMSLHAD
jgi:hypothetical protein